MNKNRRIFYVAIALAFIITAIGFWLGTMQELNSTASKFIAIGRWMGLLTTFAILLEVLLMSRAPFIEKNFDLDEISQLHRYNGFTILFGIVAHIVFITYGYAMVASKGLISQFINLNSNTPDVLNATIGTIAFFVISLSSLKLVRKKVPYELWYFTHILVYGAVLLTFLHQINAGADFVTQDWFKYYWIMLYAIVFGTINYYRFLRPVIYYFKYDFKVQSIVQESLNCYSVYITGKKISRFKYSAGQYAVFRFLNKDLWHEAHPFSFSSYEDKYLRITFKVTSGDFSNQLISLKPGTKVIIDGPRGAFYTGRANNVNVYLIAGGIGSAPLVAMLKTLIKKGKKVTFIYSAKSKNDMAFYDQLNELNGKYIRFITHLTLDGKRLTKDNLKMIYGNDIASSVTFICGPSSMTQTFKKYLKELGANKKNIITEEFKI